MAKKVVKKAAVKVAVKPVTKNPFAAMKSGKPDIASAFDMKTGVDVGKGPKTMPVKKMPMKGKTPMKKGKC